MKTLLTVLLAGTMTLGTGAAMAQGNGNGKGKGNGKHNAPVSKQFKSAPGYKSGNYQVQTNVAGCPPGLAKKNPPCVPPGQAKKYGRGDYIRDYRYIDNPGRYGLNNGYYVTAGNYVYRIDQNTREVLNLVGAVVDILN